MRLVTWAILLIVGAYLVDLCVRIAIHRAGLDTLGAWWGRFLISPAVGGLAALVAAIIGASMLWKQLQHTKEKDFDSAWWEKFEWTTDRAYPSVQTEQAIPHGLATTILQTLADTATDDLQRLACGGFMDHLYELERKQQVSAAPGSADSAAQTTVIDGSSENDALASYVKATKNTPARSVVAEALLYERQVIEALAELGDAQLVSPSAASRGYRPDAELLFKGHMISVEVKYWSETGHTQGLTRTRIKRLVQNLSGTERRWLIVSPIDVGAVASEFDSSVAFAKWTSGSDNSNLKYALEALVKQANSEDVRLT